MNPTDFSRDAGGRPMREASSGRQDADAGLPGLQGGGLADSEAIIRQAFRKDAMAGCELLFIRYYTVLCSHAARFVYSRDIAEDIVGEVYHKFMRGKVYEHIRGSFRAYLFIAVKNEALSFLRKEFGRKLPAEELLQETQSDPYLILQSHELAMLIERTVQSLPPRCRQVFLLSRVEGKKNAEIASELSLTIKAVEAQITRAISRIRSVLSKEYLSLFFPLLLTLS